MWPRALLTESMASVLNISVIAKEYEYIRTWMRARKENPADGPVPSHRTTTGGGPRTTT